MKVAAIQMNVKLGDVDHNLLRIQALVAEASAAGAELIVFPECAITGYCFDSRSEASEVAESIPGPTIPRLQVACAKHSVCVIAGMLEADHDRLFNACVWVDAQGLVGSYRKVHLPKLGVDHFVTPGDRPFAVHSASIPTVGPIRVGMLICYDASFPEASRVLALDGADIIALPTNWPFGAEPTADYVINARASENKVFVIAANRVGRERGFQFIGKSKICDVHGNTLAFADHQDETIIYADLDPLEARNKLIERVPGKHSIDRFADRRPELYGRVVEP